MESRVTGKQTDSCTECLNYSNRQWNSYLFCYRINQPDEYILLLSSTWNNDKKGIRSMSTEKMARNSIDFEIMHELSLILCTAIDSCSRENCFEKSHNTKIVSIKWRFSFGIISMPRHRILLFIKMCFVQTFVRWFFRRIELRASVQHFLP